MTQKPQSFKSFASIRIAQAFGRNAGPRQLQQSGKQGVVGLRKIDKGCSLSPPIAGNRRDEVGVARAKVTLVFRIELDHQARGLGAPGAEDLAQHPPRRKSVMIDLGRFRQGQGQHAD